MGNKLNIVRTIDAFLLVLVPLYHNFACSFALLESSSDCPTFLFQTFTRFQLVCDQRTDGWTDGRTHPLILQRCENASKNSIFTSISKGETHDFNSCVTDGWTDRPTDGRTNQRTDIPSYRDVRMHLKIGHNWPKTAAKLCPSSNCKQIVGE